MPYISTSSDPATYAFAVTPDDEMDLPQTTRMLWVGGAGNVAVLMFGDSAAVTFTAVPAGTLLPVRARRVLTTGTTATNMVGLA